MYEKLLILAKTYPNPSKNYRETVCVAAVNETGQLRRLYPIPFRQVPEDQEFKKWEWITADTIIPSNDHRPESRKVDWDSIQRTRTVIPTDNCWEERKKWITEHLVSDPDALEFRRQESGESFGFIHPTKITKLFINPGDSTDWTDEEKEYLKSINLFDSEKTKNLPMLKKIPYKFRYEYECATPTGTKVLTHTITDWEIGAFYWTCREKYGDDWEEKFRQKLEMEFFNKDMYFMLGNLFKYPNRWQIIALNYPNHPSTKDLIRAQQQSLFDN